MLLNCIKGTEKVNDNYFFSEVQKMYLYILKREVMKITGLLNIVLVFILSLKVIEGLYIFSKIYLTDKEAMTPYVATKGILSVVVIVAVFYVIKNQRANKI